MPAIKRAKHLYQASKLNLARTELYFALKQINNRQKVILAEIVANWGWYNQAIRLANKSNHRDDLSLRFPLAHQELIENIAKQQQINPALIYAVIRQESAFIPNAKSHAGALGLMQLMPQTAKNIAKKSKLRLKGKSELFNPSLNISFGSYHLKTLHKKYDGNLVLLTAAYNAGQRQVNRWRPKSRGMAADIWVETLPWNETRNYIKHVIAFYVIYQKLLEQQPRIDAFMKPV